MKNSLLFLIAVSIGIASMAQLSRNVNSRIVKSVPAVAVDLPMANPLQISNPSVNSKAVLEDNLGQTRYDLQTNEAIQNRIVLFNDGTVAGTWTTSMEDAGFSDRGSGYNYFDGASWMPLVTTRLETVKTGWPSIDKWNGNGEIVLAHNSSPTWVMNTRATKGTGAWTQTLAPGSPTGVTGTAWPRMITSGPNNQYIHLIGLTLPTGNGGTVYKGLDGALLYWRSLDGGATWDKMGVQLPGIDSSNYTQFGGDEYAWGAPVNDTIYFVLGGSYTDMFIMKSTDNGSTWTKTPILSNGNMKIPLSFTGTIAPWISSDGSVACQMDKSGVIHVASGIGGGSVYGGSKYISLFRNGLIYWNTTMPMLQDSLDLDTLDAHGQLLAYYSDGPGPGDTLLTIPPLRTGLTSFPQMSVDDYNNLYVIWTGITWQNPNSEGVNFRHIFGRAKFHDKTTWAREPVDFNDGIAYYGQEFIFTSMAKTITQDKMRLVYQTSDTPGSAVGSTTVAFHDNFLQYREIPGSMFWATGAGDGASGHKTAVSQNFPNPVRGSTSFTMQLEKASIVTIGVSNVMGQQVMNLDKGFINNDRIQKFTIDCSQLTPGVYFYSVRANGETFTNKMIVQ